MTEQERAAFYNGPRWRKFRKRILIRDEYTCQRCKRYGRITPATEVHHIKHLDEYPELAFAPSNCIALCKGCHNMQHPEKGTKGAHIHNQLAKY